MAELRRCTALGIPFLVSHPGNFIDDREAGLRRNAAAYTRCLEAVPGAGDGAARDHRRHRHLARQHLRGAVPPARGDRRARAPSDRLLRRHLSPLLRRDTTSCATTTGSGPAGATEVGFEHLHCLHLNDSKTPFGSRRDRHELIAEGSLGCPAVPADHARPAIRRHHQGDRDAEGRRRGHPGPSHAETAARVRARALALTLRRGEPIFHRCRNHSCCRRCCSSPAPLGSRPRRTTTPASG